MYHITAIRGTVKSIKIFQEERGVAVRGGPLSVTRLLIVVLNNPGLAIGKPLGCILLCTSTRIPRIRHVSGVC